MKEKLRCCCFRIASLFMQSTVLRPQHLWGPFRDFSHSTSPTFFRLFLKIHFYHVFLCIWVAILDWMFSTVFDPVTVLSCHLTSSKEGLHSTQLLSSTVNTEGASIPIRGEVQFSPECSSLKKTAIILPLAFDWQSPQACLHSIIIFISFL